MKNKYYNIFFSSENDGFGKSFRVSANSLFITIVLLSGVLFFSYLGFKRFVGLDQLSSELQELRKFKYVTSNLLIDSGLNTKLISSNDLEQIIVNYIIENNIVYPGKPPVNGYVTRGVIKNKEGVVRAGLDIASKLNDEVKSPLPGIVISTYKDNDLGNTIILHHQNNFFTIYGHLDTVFVSPRDLVMVNQNIGTVKGDGDHGPHLYFEVWKDNQIIDPRQLIDDYKDRDVSIR
tara:strand:- start:938 stop:1639 length:702 start_codon:yes stop_codon:yes gene_type:complete